MEDKEKTDGRPRKTDRKQRKKQMEDNEKTDG